MDNLFDIKGKVALITGGSKGIGKDIVKKFINSNCNVAFTYLSSDEEAEKISTVQEAVNYINSSS